MSEDWDKYDIGFRLATMDDVPLLSRWIRNPHVNRWWMREGSEEDIAGYYGEDLADPSKTQLFIALLGNDPFGFLERYRNRDHPDWMATLAAIPVLRSEETAGLDYFIGEESLLGKGLGTRMIQDATVDAFAEYPEVDRIVIAPQQENVPSWRMLEKAGYHRIWSGTLASEDPSDAGPAYLYCQWRK